jgi:hypothetical protein
MENDTRGVLLNAGLVELHSRKTAAELKGHSIKAYDSLIALYQVEIATIEDARRSRSQDTPDAA